MKKLVFAAIALIIVVPWVGFVANAVTTEPAVPQTEIVQAYYNELNAKNIEGALALLADNVEMDVVDPKLGVVETKYGKAQVRALLKHRLAHSREVSGIQLIGDKVYFIGAEWLDERVVGPSVTQPFTTEYVAQVENGKIVYIKLLPETKESASSKS
jgi:ketosteroid isomerase-like protein